MSYYERTAAVHLDGTPVFKTAEDERNENLVAALLGDAWNCSIESFGKLAPVDWYAIREDRLVGVLELKSRTHAHDAYPTVFLNVRKWLALELASLGLGVPAIFVVKFTDCVRWTSCLAGDVRMGGLTRIVKSRNDREPVMEIIVNEMQTVGASGRVAA